MPRELLGIPFDLLATGNRQFNERMRAEVVQLFWAALRAGEFITGAAEQVGTYREKGERWIAAECGNRPRRGRNLKGRCLTFAAREEIVLARTR